MGCCVSRPDENKSEVMVVERYDPGDSVDRYNVKYRAPEPMLQPPNNADRVY